MYLKVLYTQIFFAYETNEITGASSDAFDKFLIDSSEHSFNYLNFLLMFLFMKFFLNLLKNLLATGGVIRAVSFASPVCTKFNEKSDDLVHSHQPVSSNVICYC
jgi:hypothetical protein